MSLSRRKMIALVGGGVVLAATGSATAFVTTRTPTRALAPWQAAGSYDDPRLRALSYALLAPNPHNRQPWLAQLDGEDALTLRMDPGRRLPHTDPFDRQLVIGMGCFVELMVQAAAQEGLAVTLTTEPEAGPNNTPVIHARFAPGAAPDPLFAAVLERRSCKEPFDMTRKLSTAAIAPVVAAAGGFARAATALADVEVTPIREMMRAAFVTEMETERTYVESIDLIRVGKREIEANPDGIDLGGPMMEALRLAGQLDREDLLNTGSAAYRSTMEMYDRVFAATPAALWLTTETNDRPAQLSAGRAWVRVNLAATLAGLSLHPVSQALQEYPEMAPHYAWVHETLAAPGETVQMLGRIGYGPAVAKAPRWALETRMIGA